MNSRADIYNQTDLMAQDEERPETGISIIFTKKGKLALSHMTSISHDVGEVFHDMPENKAQEIVDRGDGEYYVGGMLPELPAVKDEEESSESIQSSIEAYRASLSHSFEELSNQLVEQSKAHSQAQSEVQTAIQSDIASLAKAIEQLAEQLAQQYEESMQQKPGFFSRLFKKK